MNTRTWMLLMGATLAAANADAGDACRCHFEAMGPSRAPIVSKRLVKTADAGTCAFDVGLRATGGDPDTCGVTKVVVRGVPNGTLASAEGWTGWDRVTLRARRTAKRRVLRARMHMADGSVAKARMTLRCEPSPTLPGCEDVLAEPTSCFLGGGSRLRMVGLESASVCRNDGDTLALELMSRNLAVWHGDAYTCSSAVGGFVATPLDGSEARIVAGLCAATATDGERLLVLPSVGFDQPPAAGTGGIQHRGRGPTGERIDPSIIRAYDAPDALRTGTYATAFDLDTIPEESPCAGLSFAVMTAHDGYVYAAGCRRSLDVGNLCTPDSQICVFDTRAGTVLPPITLEGFTGEIRGMSVVGDGRLVVLTSDQTALPPIGYEGTPIDGVPTSSIPQDRLHVFDVASGARLDTKVIATSFALGLACETRAD